MSPVMMCKKISGGNSGLKHEKHNLLDNFVAVLEDRIHNEGINIRDYIYII